MNKYGKLCKFVRKELIKRLEAMKKENVFIVKYLSDGSLVDKLFESENKKDRFFGNEKIARQWLKAYFDMEERNGFEEWYKCDDFYIDNNPDEFVLRLIIETAHEVLISCKTYKFNIEDCNSDEWYGHPYNIIKELKEAA